ncbi:MAG TPA: extracellular solute-binding protein, partial [Microbacteriaceae bacterium]|nr:extracellular solute-binding protein [Microbacteriaceae bacterium]
MRSITRHRRKITALAALAAAAALALSGCSGGGSNGSAGSTSGSGGSSSKTLTVWHYFSTPTQVKLMTDEAKLFEGENPGVTVKNVYVPYNNMDSKLITAAGSQTGPDVVVFNGGDADNIENAGALLDISKQWSNYADSSQFPASAIHKLDGKVYSVQGYVNLLGLWYNADILKKIGVQPPTTMGELNSDMAKAVKAGFGGITLSGQPQSQGEFQAYPWLTEAGFSYANPSVKTLAAGLTTAQQWVKKGYLTGEASTWDQTVPFQKWAAGKIAFAENGNWQIATAKQTAKFTYGVVPLPLGANGTKVYLGGEAEGIGRYSKNPSLAWKYLEATFFSKKGQLIALKDEGNIPSRKDAAADPQVSGNK